MIVQIIAYQTIAPQGAIDERDYLMGLPLNN